MEITINIVQLASDLAHEAVIDEIQKLLDCDRDYAESKVFVESDEGLSYTEDCQELFNKYYDTYWDIIENAKPNS
jgi:hypothetical protein